MSIKSIVAGVAGVFVCAGAAWGQQAVQWRVEDGGNGHWYELAATNRMAWVAARDWAKSRGGHLATFSTAAEWDQIWPRFNGQDGYWIGFFQDPPSGLPPADGWRWVTDEPVTFSAWGPSEPNDWLGYQQWVVQTGNAAWDDTLPDATHIPIVEWSADCNSDGIVDYGQIMVGEMADVNSNGVPDTCETLRVPADFPTIQAAINAAVNGATVLVAPGSYSPFNFNGKRITVQSTNGAAVTTIDASGQNVSAVVFGIGATFNTTLRGMTIKTGNAGGGGGVLLNGDGTPTGNCDGTIEDCRFIRGEGTVGYGGGLYSEYGNVVVRRCLFDGLHAQHFHGAMGIAMTAHTSVPGLPGVSVLVEDCEIRNCSSWNSGGVGVRGIQSSTALFRRVHFSGNSSPFSTGALITGTGDATVVMQLDIDRCVFTGNSGPFSSGISEGLPLPGKFAPMVINITGSIFADIATSIVTRGSTQLRIQGTRFCSGTGAIGSPYADLGGNLFSCEAPTDCDLDGMPDAFAIVLGRVADVNGNVIPDSCEGLIRVPQDFPTIQSAIDSIAVGTRGTVLVAPGIYPGPVDFRGKDVVVRGTDADSTVIDGSGGLLSSVVRLSGNEPSTAALERVTVRGGLTGSPIPQAPQFLVGGGLFANGSAACVRECVFENNFASYGGGAYLLNYTGRMERCSIRNNNAGADGGGALLFGGTPTMSDCSVVNNRANSRGGGLHLVSGVQLVERVDVSNNHSDNVVGGISWVPNENPAHFLRLVDVSVQNNTAAIVQGGIGVLQTDSSVKMSVQNSVACGNLPRPNVVGRFDDLGGNEICDCLGDVNLDGLVNGADLSLVLSSWGSCGGVCPYDLNDDGIVNGSDLSKVLSEWGVCR